MNNPRMFTMDDILPPLEGYPNSMWCFHQAMVSRCKPLLDDCYDNVEATRLLRNNLVINISETKMDSESDEMFLYFYTKEAGERFIKRLNRFIMKSEYSESIPYSDPQCKALQGGTHSDYSEGLVLSKQQMSEGKNGEWYVKHGDRFANVHPIYDHSGFDQLVHNGLWVWGVRFWVKQCADCMGPYSWGQCQGSCDGGA